MISPKIELKIIHNKSKEHVFANHIFIQYQVKKSASHAIILVKNAMEVIQISAHNVSLKILI